MQPLMKTRYPILALILSALGSPPAIAADASLGFVLSAHCVDCHGKEGISARSTTPTIAGQKEGYLTMQLIRFRDLFQRKFGQRQFQNTPPAGSQSVPMDHEAGIMSDSAIENLAAYYSRLSCRQPRATASPARPAVIQQCASCHGSSGVSSRDDVPNLAGQKENYLVLQIGAFRQWNRFEAPDAQFPKRYHPIMSEVGHPLTNGQIRSAAAWYANQDCP
jgi:cytochrome c553